MKRTVGLGIALLIGAILCLPSLAIPVRATSTAESDMVNQILRNNPGSTKEDVISSADKIAEETGKTRNGVLEDFIRGEKQNALSRSNTLSELGVLGTKDGNSYQLPRSYYEGDMYLTPAYTVGVNHGHIGIYGDTDWVVEAPGPGKKSKWAWHHEIWVAKGTVLMETRLTQAQQDAAADYAYNNLVDYPYNIQFWNNKESNPQSLNCSQLVWLAYLKGAGVDLDGNDGSGVYPYDIKESKYTKVNWTVE